MRVIFVVACAAIVSASTPTLPSMSVSGWTADKVEEVTDRISSQPGGWWIRIADNLYSPNLAAVEESLDSNISHYWLVFGKSIPNPYNNMVAASDDRFGGVSIVYSRLGEPSFKSATASRPLALHNGLSLFRDVRQRAEMTGDMSLEKQLEEDDEDEALTNAVNTVTDDKYLQEIVDLITIGSGPMVQRHITSEGHGIAQQYLACRMKKANLNVQLLKFKTGSATGMDVLGCKPGRDKKFLVVGAHYDTLPTPPSKSPGAMDNGSGVAVVLTAMDAVASLKFSHTLCFAAFDGEELGLVGSRHMANVIKKSSNLRNNFLGAITSDMSTGFHEDAFNKDHAAGYTEANSRYLAGTHDPAIDGIHIDGNKASEDLIRKVGRAALKVVKDKNLPVLDSVADIWNSDHKAFHSSGLAAVDMCAANHRQYSFWHDSRNTTGYIDPKIGAEISRATIAASFSLAGRRGRNLEEDDDDDAGNLPAFKGAQSFDQVFANTDCETLLSRGADTSSAAPQAIKAAKGRAAHLKRPFKPTHMSFETAKELEDVLGHLEDVINRVERS